MKDDQANATFDLTKKRQALLAALMKKEGIKSDTLAKITPKKDIERYPLSFSQQRLWFLDRWEPNSFVYNIPVVTRLVGTLKIEALQRSLQEIVKRHQVLRSIFYESDGVPIQEVLPEWKIEIPILDLSHEANKEYQLHIRISEEARRPFDLAKGPLLTAKIIRLKVQEHVLLLNMHHIVSDGWSIGVLFRELKELYAAFVNDQQSPLQELPIQYRDYALWQRERIQGDRLVEQLAFWKKDLAGIPTLLNLPIDRPRPRVQSYEGKKYSFTMSESLTEQLHQLSRSVGTTLFMTLLAVFQVFLYRYTGQQQFLVDSPIANRNRKETEGIIGFFVNTLVFRADFTVQSTFLEFLEQVRKQTLDVYEHQELPFEKLVEELNPERSLGHQPLTQVSFLWQNMPTSTVNSEETLKWEPIQTGTDSVKSDLSLALAEVGNRLEGSMAYRTDLFEESTIERMIGHFLLLLESLAENPNQRINEVSILSEKEREKILFKWNDTKVQYPQAHLCLHEMFEEQVQKTPDAIAVVFEQEVVSYRELNERANRLAHVLQRIGVGPEVLVGVCMERSVEMVISLYAILKAGGAYVPIDPSYPAGRLQYLFEDSQISVLLTQEHLLKKLPHHNASVLCLNPEASDAKTLMEESIENPVSELQVENVAYMIYTSGSTGRPKGVLNTHRGIVNRLLWMQDQYRLTSEDRVLQKTPFSFDVSVWEFFWPLMVGATLIVAQAEGHRDSGYLLKMIRSHNITTLHFVPSMLQVFLEEVGLEACSSLRFVFTSGEVLPYELRDRFYTRMNAALHNLYGPTEAAVDVTYWDCEQGNNLSFVPIGLPVANTQIYILDRSLQPVPMGAIGELHIGGVQVARGYHRQPELTSKKFIANPFAEGQRLYKTGDLARFLPDGTIQYLGRVDNQVKIRGLRIEIGEIETAILRHPHLREVAVLTQGEGLDNMLLAFAVPKNGERPDTEEVRTTLRYTLPEYMVPHQILIIDHFPLLPNGKRDLRALLALVESRQKTEYIAPRTEQEAKIADVWSQVLGVEQVGVNDNFFDRGGHSLLATQIVSRIRNIWGVEIPVRVLYEEQTVAGFSERVAKLVSVNAPQIKPRGSIRDLPLSFAQLRMWFLDQLEPGQPTYHIPVPLMLEGALDLVALESSFGTIIQRHESLRTRFEFQNGQPVQVILDTFSFEMQKWDLRTEPDREIVAHQLLRQEVMQPFNLQTGPLLRASLFQIEDEKHLLALTLHHIVSDGWSIDLLVKELTVCYDAYVKGQDPMLPELAVQYADYAVWQREWLQGEGNQMEQQLAYWKQQLSNLPPLLELPTDRPRPRVQTFNGARVLVNITKNVLEGVQHLCREEKSSTFMVLLAAFQTLLYRYTGQTDIVVGSPIAGRNRTEIEDLIGVFLNTVVLRNDLSGQPTFRELLRRTREITLHSYANQELPFEKLVEELNPDRELSYGTLFQTMMGFQTRTPSFERNQVSGALNIRPIPVEMETVKCDLSLSLVEGDGEVSGALHYNTDLFDSGTVELMVCHYQNLIAKLIKNPDLPISEVQFLSEKEMQLLRFDWNNKTEDIPPETCLHERFERQAAQQPDSNALVFENRILTYGELNEMANQLAHWLQKQGVCPEVMVGLCVERSIEMVVGILGILKAGGVYVPLDPSYPNERLSYMLRDADVSLLLTQEHLTNHLPTYRRKRLFLDSDWKEVEKESKERPTCQAKAEDLAYVIYTSGSTGRPKGVMVPHRGATHYMHFLERTYDLTPNDRILQLPSISFDPSVRDILGALSAGAQLVLIRHEELFDLKALYEAFQSHRITAVLSMVPSVLKIVSQAAIEQMSIYASLRLMLVSGEALTVQDLMRARQVVPRTARIVNQYGPTETTMTSTYYDTTEWEESSPILIGRPIPNAEIYLMDSHLNLVPVGVPGEICIGGIGVTRGYLNQPEQTADRFIQNPFATRDGEWLYRTGDMGRYHATGEIEYIGRIDNQVKIRGFRIELCEIECVLMQQDAVRQAIVHAQRDDRGQQRLVAYLVVDDEQNLHEVTLAVREKLPEYMVPSIYLTLNEIPLTPNGKVDRKALPRPNFARPVLESEYQLPRTKTEEQLVQIWMQVLNVEQVGVYDNFFALGGHSLLAVQIISRIREVFHLEVPLRYLFEVPCIADLAEKMEGLRRESKQIPPISHADRSRALPLSFAQQRLWFFDQLEPDNTMYNITNAIRLQGNLNLDVLEQSLNEIIKRHEVLRTTFHVLEGRPYQNILLDLNLGLERVDLQTLADDRKQQAVQEHIKSEAQRNFQISVGPLLSLKVIRVQTEEYVLILTMHHIISDAWSFGLFMSELQTHYVRFNTDEVKPLMPQLSIQYVDYAVWQHDCMEHHIDKQLEYWKEQLQDAPPLLSLPTDRPRPAKQTYRGNYISFRLSAELAQALYFFSNEEGTSLFMTLLSAFKVMLYRYSGQADILVGTPVSNRHQRELESLIGFFVNTLVLRTNLSEVHSFRDLVREVRRVTLDGYAHQDLPFEKLVEDLNPVRDLSYSPLFQVMFLLHNTSVTQNERWDFNMSPLEPEIETVKYDLHLSLLETDQEIIGNFFYNTDLYDGSTIERMISHYHILLEALVQNPDQNISEVPLLSDKEREQVLLEWNMTDVEYPNDVCLHQLFERQVERTPDAVALVFEQEQLSYREVNERANQLAHYLQKQGVGPEELVGICMERSLEMVVSLFAILKAGGAYVPFDPSYPTERLMYMMEDSGVHVMVTTEDVMEKLPRIDALVLCINPEATDASDVMKESTDNPSCYVHAENAAYMIYTSGSTGKPKGVLNTHRGIVNRLLWMQDEYLLSSQDRVLQKTPYSFDVSVWEFFWPLLFGAQLVVARPEGHRDPVYLVGVIQEQEITILHFVPSMLQLFLEADGVENCKSLRHVMTSGESLPYELQERFFTRLLAGLNNLYGPTEAAVDVTYWACERGSALNFVPIGRPIANTQMYILDRFLQPVPIGVVGELHIGGVQLARGYHNRADLTAEKFIASPFDEGQILYKTGDLARFLTNGVIQYLGRLDNQVKIRGMRIETGEIEAALLCHPHVREVVVTTKGEGGDKRLLAYIVPEKGEQLDVMDVRVALTHSLPDHMVPSSFTIIEEFPQLSNGKIDRQSLLELEASLATPQNDYVAPRDFIELEMATIWENILETNHISVYDNFFTRGGHSMRAVAMVGAIYRKFGVRLPLSLLFQAPTVAALAEHLREMDDQEQSVILPIQAGDGTRPPIFCIHPLGGGVLCYAYLAQELDHEETVYGIEAFGYQTDDEILTTIEDMASAYVKEIRRVHPEGPYRLIGWSLGGIISVEMASQLETVGCEVQYLGLIDTKPEISRDNLDPVSSSVAKVLAVRFDMQDYKPDTDDEEQALAQLLSEAKRLRKFPQDASLEMFLRLGKVWVANELALLAYCLPDSIAADIHLYGASEEMKDTKLVDTDQWKRYTSGKVLSTTCEGNHQNMMYPPRVHGMARSIQAHLNQIQNKVRIH